MPILSENLKICRRGMVVCPSGRAVPWAVLRPGLAKMVDSRQNGPGAQRAERQGKSRSLSQGLSPRRQEKRVRHVA